MKIAAYLTGGLAFAAVVFAGGIYTTNPSVEWTGIAIGVIIILSSILLKMAKVLK